MHGRNWWWLLLLFLYPFLLSLPLCLHQSNLLLTHQFCFIHTAILFCLIYCLFLHFPHTLLLFHLYHDLLLSDLFHQVTTGGWGWNWGLGRGSSRASPLAEEDSLLG